MTLEQRLKDINEEIQILEEQRKKIIRAMSAEKESITFENRDTEMVFEFNSKDQDISVSLFEHSEYKGMVELKYDDVQSLANYLVHKLDVMTENF